MHLVIWPSIPRKTLSSGEAQFSGSSFSVQADIGLAEKRKGKATNKKDMWTSEAVKKLRNTMNCGISVFFPMNVYAFTFFICYV